MLPFATWAAGLDVGATAATGISGSVDRDWKPRKSGDRRGLTTEGPAVLFGFC